MSILKNKLKNKYSIWNKCNVKPAAGLQNCSETIDQTLEFKNHNNFMLSLKRLIDIFGSLVAIIILFPILLSTWLIVKVLMHGSATFVQDRIGKDETIFKMYKFKTMIDGAQKHDEEKAKITNVNSRDPNDHRITEVGKFLRKFSIDELPQLFNVLKGDMSLVGPRPYALYEYEKLDERQKKIKTRMKPGLTCILQIKGRTLVSDYETRSKMDLEYINNWSLWLDIKLLFITIPVVLHGKGAS